MSVLKRYWNFMLRNKLVALLTATSTILSTLVGTQIEMPSYVTPLVAFVTLFLGSLFVFKRQERQITSKLLGELEDFSNTFYSLNMAGSGENRANQIRFMLDRVGISDRSQKEILQLRLNHIKMCHNLIEKWFKFYKNEVEYFLKHPKSIDVTTTVRLVNEFKEIVSSYLDEVIGASIDYMNKLEKFPEDIKKRFDPKFDTFKTKYNHLSLIHI